MYGDDPTKLVKPCHRGGFPYGPFGLCDSERDLHVCSNWSRMISGGLHDLPRRTALWSMMSMIDLGSIDIALGELTRTKDVSSLLFATHPTQGVFS